MRTASAGAAWAREVVVDGNGVAFRILAVLGWRQSAHGSHLGSNEEGVGHDSGSDDAVDWMKSGELAARGVKAPGLPDSDVEASSPDDAGTWDEAVEHILPNRIDLDQQRYEAAEDDDHHQPDQELERPHRGRDHPCRVCKRVIESGVVSRSTKEPPTLIEEQQDEEDVERGEEDRSVQRDLGDQPGPRKGLARPGARIRRIQLTG